MKSLNSDPNIPQSPRPKQIQLGIESFTKKRERENLENPRMKKIKVLGQTVYVIDETVERNEIDPICHQCRHHVRRDLSVQCTAYRVARTKVPEPKRCSIVYCLRCLANRYNEKMADILARTEVSADHVPDAGYTWPCPICRKECNCSVCRKKMGLAPTGYASEYTNQIDEKI
jgi:hypothetical protein